MHKYDAAKNVEVGFTIDEGGKVTWSNIPQAYMILLQSFFDHKFMQKYPAVALRAILVEAQQ